MMNVKRKLLEHDEAFAWTVLSVWQHHQTNYGKASASPSIILDRSAAFNLPGSRSILTSIALKVGDKWVVEYFNGSCLSISHKASDLHLVECPPIWGTWWVVISNNISCFIMCLPTNGSTFCTWKQVSHNEHWFCYSSWLLEFVLAGMSVDPIVYS